jgi:hypothetical protein
MFDRLKKSLSKDAPPPVLTGTPRVHDEMVAWGLAQGLNDAAPKDGKGFAMTGTTSSRPWTLECGRSSRDYIRGDELRAKADLKVNDDAVVLIMNRPLKNALETRAYEMYTDTLQTTADPSLPEEMRWLAMYPEADWPSMPRPFWNRYVALSDQLEHAVAWIDEDLMGQLVSWPTPAPDDQVPFILMLLRGKAYLRMQYTPGDLVTLAHAARIFTKACSSAVSGLAAGPAH